MNDKPRGDARMIDETALARLARQYSKEAIATLVFAIRTSTDLRIKVTAALGLLDRGYGKPAPAKRPAVAISLEDLDQMIAHIEAELARRSADPDAATTSMSDDDAIPNASSWMRNQKSRILTVNPLHLACSRSCLQTSINLWP